MNPGILAGHLTAQLALTCILYASTGMQLTAISKAVAAIAYMDAGCLALLLGMLSARTVVYRSPARELNVEEQHEQQRKLLKAYLSLYAAMALVIPGIAIWSTTIMIRTRWAAWLLFALQMIFVLHLTLSQAGLGIRPPLFPQSPTPNTTHPAPAGPTPIGTKRNDPNVEDSIELLSDANGHSGIQAEGSGMVLATVVAVTEEHVERVHQ
ncbi:hypothetical protein BCR44DRAFT_47339 [Catenaria anguillulae PL171]|uniref:Uncharacterized protein n=1 Tax=Catenaria anguillulae PL171 TaxID=765915 RepID=A0A1Y2HQW8_9FUNG|nr:hypothetical protein BCR44DRAFT_47339 [Catenaria anguillulae PL171]